MNEKDNFDDDFHPMLDEQSDEIDGDESLKAPLVEAVTKNSAKQGALSGRSSMSDHIKGPGLWKFEKPKAKTFGLGSQADWEDLIMEVEEDAKKKNPSRVEVLVEDDYLPALRARLGGKEPPVSWGKNKNKLLNLDTPSDSNMTRPGFTPLEPTMKLAGNTTDKPDGENLYHDILLKRLTSCINCPHQPGSYCLKTVNNAHVRFTAQHVSSWVKAWASGIMGISDEMPPNTPLFSHFFSAPTNSKVEPPKLAGGVRASEAIQIPSPLPSNISLNSSNMAAFPDIHSLLMTQVVGMSQMQMQMLQNMLGTPRRKVVSSPNPGATDGTIIVGDSTDYLRFDEYFESIGDKVIDRDLGAILAKLTDSGVYRVHELAWFTDAELKEAGLVIGDVKWLRNEVKKAMQKELHV
ncbi:hypothetical protein BU17DRAFT_103637 [Hysterangium stoloniferum]|nr:hypothetical protein BU17DRAFT_103637 [Hysterangium stoloniferum]